MNVLELLCEIQKPTNNKLFDIKRYEIAQKPTEGKLFEVKPSEIDRSKFEKRRRDSWQETKRVFIRKAFAELDKYPEKYASPFYTLIPKKTWEGETIILALEVYAKHLGGETADWVEQALEWAQRISNGESWEDICNKPDISKTLDRVIYWCEGYYKIITCRKTDTKRVPDVQVIYGNYVDSNHKTYGVPLVVFKQSKI